MLAIMPWPIHCWMERSQLSTGRVLMMKHARGSALTSSVRWLTCAARRHPGLHYATWQRTGLDKDNSGHGIEEGDQEGNQEGAPRHSGIFI